MQEILAVLGRRGVGLLSRAELVVAMPMLRVRVAIVFEALCSAFGFCCVYLLSGLGWQRRVNRKKFGAGNTTVV